MKIKSEFSTLMS